MDYKNKEHNKLQIQTTELLRNLKRYDMKTVLQEEEPQFVLIPGKRPVKSMLKEATKNTHKTIDVIAPWEICQSTYYHWSVLFKKCLHKGVKIRYIIDTPPEKNLFQNITKKFRAYPCFEMRYSMAPSLVVVSVYDRKAVAISSTILTPMETPDLWITNPPLVALIQDYFETVWTKAIEIDREIIHVQ
ncbi:MAG: hypothetical protein CW691_07910 [Candidatus Bathyarchaeum sp.]|nr:MAG: hypothetical protein CW691_07910 [Candidatus Bathyarchaeum sp.]